MEQSVLLCIYGTSLLERLQTLHTKLRYRSVIGELWPAACFCMAHELRMAFTFLNGGEKYQKKK